MREYPLQVFAALPTMTFARTLRWFRSNVCSVTPDAFRAARLYLALSLATVSTSLAAQVTGTVAGTVARDGGGSIGHAEVILVPLNRNQFTSANGKFQFLNVPVGRYAIVIRAVGFAPAVDSIVIKPGARLDADVTLTELPIELPTVHTAAPTESTSPELRAMEDRRKAHLGGYFITDSVLRRSDDGRRLSSLMIDIPGLQLVYGTDGPQEYLSSNRFTGKDHAGPGFPAARCYVTVFVNGLRYFVGPSGPNNPPPDFGSMLARDYSGIEYYPGGASVPPEFNATGTGCGTLLLWTRH